MDKLKQYLQENSEGLDVNQPGDEVWDKIQKAGNLQPSAKRVLMYPARAKRLWLYAAAASVIVLLFAGLKWITQKPGTESIALASVPVPAVPKNAIDTASFNNSKPSETIAAIKEPAKTPLYPAVNPYELLGSFSHNYRQLVKLQLKSIRRTPVLAEDPAYFDDFKTALVQIDRNEKGIRAVIKKQGISEDLIEQLINLYQQKLDVLKTLQSEINKLNNRAKEDHPRSDSLSGYFLNI